MAFSGIDAPDVGAQAPKRGNKVRLETEVTCKNCGEPFLTKKADRVVCSRQCHNQHQALKARVATCEQCGIAFRPNRPSSRAVAGVVANGRFCSAVCYGASRQKAKATVVSSPCMECGAPVLRSGSATCGPACSYARSYRLSREAVKARAPTRIFQCRTCGEECVALYADKRLKFCGAACSNAAMRRIRKPKERARLKAAFVESVDPIKVFERDGWRCHLCGKATPRKLRGSCQPRAPELDHIVPLSLGGDHSYRNTACSCRSCNQIKGAKLIGQPSLFSFGM